MNSTSVIRRSAWMSVVAAPLVVFGACVDPVRPAAPSAPPIDEVAKESGTSRCLASAATAVWRLPRGDVPRRGELHVGAFEERWIISYSIGSDERTTITSGTKADESASLPGDIWPFSFARMKDGTVIANGSAGVFIVDPTGQQSAEPLLPGHECSRVIELGERAFAWCAPSGSPATAPALLRIERRVTGERLGVAIVDSAREVRLLHADERFFGASAVLIIDGQGNLLQLTATEDAPTAVASTRVRSTPDSRPPTSGPDCS